MSGYTKLFNSILASTIWRANDKTRLVWITLLAMADKDGICEGSIPGLADMARVSIEDCEAALAELQAPDPYSRTSEHEGRRIETIDGVGWLLLNHAKYRAKMSEDERREYNRQKQAEWRAKQKALHDGQEMSNNVNDSQSQSAMSAHTEADTDTKAEKEEKNAASPRIIQTPPPDHSYPPPILKPADRDRAFIDWFDAIAKAMGAKNRFGLTRQAKWKEVVLTCMNEGYQPSELVTVIDATLSDPKFEMKYFSPEKTLDELRLRKRPKANSSKLQSAAEKIAADEADRANRIRPPVQRVSES